MDAHRSCPPRLLPLWLAVATLWGTSVSAQEAPTFQSVVSREFTIANRFLPDATPEPILSVASRELSIANRFLPTSTSEPILSVASREFTIGLSVADLVVSEIVVTPRSGLPGRPASVAWRVTNTGGGTARGNWVDRVFVSDDPEIGRDTLVGEVVYDGPELKGGEGYQDTLTFQYPVDAGQFWLVVETGYLGAFGEEDLDDNATRDELAILVDQPPSPDLVVTEIVAPVGVLLAGSTSELTYRVENQSTNPTYVSTWSDTVFLTLSQQLSGSLGGEPFPLGTFDNPSVLLPGEGYTQTVRFTLPEKILGQFFFAVYGDNRRLGSWRVGDTYDQLEENESNNWAFSSVVEVDITSSQPDLLAESLTFLREASTATSYTVSWTDSNIGSGPTDVGSWTDSIYLSPNQDPAIGVADQLLGTRARSGDPLLAGMREPLSFETVLRADLFGTYFVKVEVDSTRAISEFGFEGNNVSVASEPLEIGLSPAVDLTPDGLTVPPIGFPGHTAVVSFSVRNIGFPPLALAYRWHDAIYISEDDTWNPAEDPLLGRFSRSTARNDAGFLTLQDYESTVTVRLPEFLAARDYRLVVVVDEGQSLFEGFDNPGSDDDALKENNNVLVSALFSVSRLSTDLAIDVSFATEAELTSAAGVDQEIALTWQVTNVGDLVTPTNSWRDAVYLSGNEVLDPSDRALVLTTRSFSLGPGETYIEAATARVPAQPPGDYFLIFRVDDSDGVLELASGELNNITIAPFEVTTDGADLRINDIRGPDAASSGDSIVVEWTVENAGTLATQRNLWTDRVYLSRDGALDAADLILGTRSRGDFLDAGETYDVAAAFPLPVELSGNFQVIVETDATRSVLETNESNNTGTRSMALDVELLPTPNLVVTDVRVDGEVVSGQAIRVTWTVRNTGAGVTTASRWRDSVFLSRDGTLEPDSDLFLGSRERLDDLAPGASYTASAELDVELGTSGQFVVFVLTDRGASNFEEGSRADNERAGEQVLDVTLPLPSDLIVSAVSVPSPTEVGETVVLEWQIENLIGQPVGGRWSDSVFLSVDDILDSSDVFVQRFTSIATAPIVAGATRTFQGSATIPGVTPGPYHVIVRTNVLAQVHEANLTNNTTASISRLTVGIPALTLDAPPLRSSVALGLDRHFALDTPASQTVRVTLDHDALSAWTELYVAYERPASPGDFDYRFTAVGEADQMITIPDSEEGTYFVLARATRGPTVQNENATLRASTIPFSLETVLPAVIGDRGRVTLTCRGSRFGPTDTILLTGPGGHARAARDIRFVDTAHLEATFVLEGIAHGLYTASVARAEGEAAVLANALTVEATSHPILEVAQPDPPALRAGAAGGTMDLVVVNRGNVDAEYVFLLNAFETGAEREVVRAQSSSPFTRDVVRDTVFRESTLIRSLAPGKTGTLSLTLQAGKHAASDIPIGQAAAVFTTEKFLDFQGRAAEAVRQSLLATSELLLDPSIEQSADDILAFAQDTVVWRSLWFSQLVAVGLVETADVLTFEPKAPAVPGQARCIGRTQIGRFPSPLCTSMEGILCDEWARRLVESGVEATGVFAATPFESAGSPPIACRLGEFVSCTLCTFWPVKNSLDPNEKTGGEGTGDEGFVPASGAIEYRIAFENEGSASGPASVVRIVDNLDPGLNTASVRFGEIEIGGRVVDTPLDAPVVGARFPVNGEDGLDVVISARVDAASDRVLWTFRTVERTTGLEPTDGRKGFLPPADGSDRSKGSVQFSVRPKPDVISRVEIRNEAEIFFDANDEITTTTVAHTIDADAPQSSVIPTIAFTANPSIPVTWGGFDPIDGSGLSAYTVYVSENDGPFVPFLSNTSETFTVFDGRPDTTYSFYSRAVDHAGNEEDAPSARDASVTILSERPFRRGDTDDNGEVTINDGIRLLGFLFLGGVDVACPDAADADDVDGLALTDAVYSFNWLFNGGPEPVAPGPFECGIDATPDGLGACSAASCN